MLLSSAKTNQRRQIGVLLSLATHAAVLLIAFLFTLHFGRVRPVYRESRCCTAALYWTGNMGNTTPAEMSAHKKKTLPSPIPIPKSSLIENPVHLRQPRTTQQATPAQRRLA